MRLNLELTDAQANALYSLLDFLIDDIDSLQANELDVSTMEQREVAELVCNAILGAE